MNSPSVIGYIEDQPRTLKEMFSRRDEFVKPFLDFIDFVNVKKIVFLGSGTSFNVSTIAAHLFKQFAKIDAIAMIPTVFTSYELPDWTGELEKNEVVVFGTSQSGTSISTINAMKKAKELGYPTVVLSENLESEITNHVDRTIPLLCGKELLPPETRGYTGSLITMILLALEVGKVKAVVSVTEYEGFILEITNLIENYQGMLDEAKVWYEHNKTLLVNSERINVLGYGIDYGSALEGMLKIGEMLRLPTIGYEIEEYVHGPTMSLNPRQSIIIIGSDEAEWDRMLRFRDIFKLYTDRVFLISFKEVEHDSRDLIFSKQANKYLAPLAYTLPLQLVAAVGARDIGIDTGVNPFKHRLGHL